MPPKVFTRKRKRGAILVAESPDIGDAAGIEVGEVDEGTMAIEVATKDVAGIVPSGNVGIGLSGEVDEGTVAVEVTTKDVIGVSPSGNVGIGPSGEVDKGTVAIEVATEDVIGVTPSGNVGIGPSGLEEVIVPEGVLEAVGLAEVSGEGAVLLSLGGSVEVVEGMIDDAVGLSSQLDDLEYAGVALDLASSVTEVLEEASAPTLVVTEGVDTNDVVVDDLCTAKVVERGVPVIDSGGVIEGLERGSTSVVAAEGVSGIIEEDDIARTLRKHGFDLEMLPDTEGESLWEAGEAMDRDFMTGLDRVISDEDVAVSGQTEPPRVLDPDALEGDGSELPPVVEPVAVQGFVNAGLFVRTPTLIAMSVPSLF